jgi:Fic family protein
MKPAIPEKLPITTLDWAKLIPVIGEANRSVARFDGLLTHMPYPELLRAPLLTREAVLSSKIEGTAATSSDVFRFEAGEDPEQPRIRLDVEEIVNYRLALKAAQKELKARPFSLNLLRKLHKVLMLSVRGHNKAPGDFRRFQNYIGRIGASMEEATFIPPSPDKLMAGLDNWERYYHADEKDALVQLALLHAQFEFLHPFLDGNGRIGRILIPVFLFDRKILSTPAFYLSEYLEENRDAYIGHLSELKRGGEAWDRWCVFFVRGISVQAQWNVHRVQSVLKLYERVKERMFAMTSSRAVLPLLDAMFAKPVFQVSAMLKVPGMLQRPQLIVLLDRLVQGKVLRVLTPARGRRGAMYSLHELVKLCDSRPGK